MKALFLGLSLVLGISIISGCQNQSKAHESSHQLNDTGEIKAPKVEIIANEHVDKGLQETIVASVKYGEEFVDDAEVVFEIKKDEEGSEKIPAELVEKGEYSINYTFKSDGMYQVIAHTNAKGYHIMPLIQIHVGESEGSAKHVERSESTHHDHE